MRNNEWRFRVLVVQEMNGHVVGYGTLTAFRLHSHSLLLHLKTVSSVESTTNQFYFSWFKIYIDHRLFYKNDQNVAAVCC